jgi:hypothetical protein
MCAAAANVSLLLLLPLLLSRAEQRGRVNRKDNPSSHRPTREVSVKRKEKGLKILSFGGKKF